MKTSDDDGIVVDMLFVYILRCADRSLYVGHTSDPEVRKRAHDEGTASNHTAKRRPLELINIEACASRAEAVERERQLKRWSHAKKEALIEGDTSVLHALSNDAADSAVSATLRASGESLFPSPPDTTRRPSSGPLSSPNNERANSKLTTASSLQDSAIVCSESGRT